MCYQFQYRRLIQQKLTPNIDTADVNKGYLSLAPEWLKETPDFQLNIAFDTRYIVPSPHSNQDIVALARGPLVYCLEDIDNKWVQDHFKVSSKRE